MDSSSDDDDLPQLVARQALIADRNSESLDENYIDQDEEYDDEELYIDSLKPAVDLFSKKTFRTAEECLLHCRHVHGLDLALLKRRHAMDTFSYIRFVNYLRTESPSPGFVMSLSSDKKWEDAAFLKPVIEDDPLLMIDFDEIDENSSSLEEPSTSISHNDDEEDTGCYSVDISRDVNDQIENPRAMSAGNSISNNSEEFNHRSGESSMNSSLHDDDLYQSRNLLQGQPVSVPALIIKIQQLEREVQIKDNELSRCLEDMEKMRSVAKALTSSDSSELSVSRTNSSARSNKRIVTVAEQKTVEEDSAYFQSYAHYSIHHEMLSDTVRTEGYRDAIMSNAARVISGSRVLDLGCGTGILSMFAAKAGAKIVVGVDCSDVVYSAMDIVRENNMSDTVKVVKGRLEELTEMPDGVKQFDLIVSEWMGYFLLFEGMLDSVIAARDRFLAVGGKMLPNRSTIRLVAVSDTARYGRVIEFWDDVYDFKMNCMRQPILEEASVEVVPSDCIVSPPATVLDLNIDTCSVEDTEFSSDFTLTIERDCDLTAIAGYFDTYFDLLTPVMFSTGPLSKPTHWKQTVFFLPSRWPVTAGQELQCKIVCKRMKSDSRSLKVALTINDKIFKYTVD